MTNAKPCGCTGADLCAQHIQALPPEEARRARCRAGRHTRTCPPETCPEKRNR